MESNVSKIIEKINRHYYAYENNRENIRELYENLENLLDKSKFKIDCSTLEDICYTANRIKCNVKKFASYSKNAMDKIDSLNVKYYHTGINEVDIILEKSTKRLVDGDNEMLDYKHRVDLKYNEFIARCKNLKNAI
jgi:hypothetical protein